MQNERMLTGSWAGELVDVHGFRGELGLDLAAGGKGDLKGVYRIAIGTQHDTLVRKGEIAGTVSGGKLKLAFSTREPPVKMGLEADVIPLREGGLGLRGTYEVSARGFSALQGGIVVLAKDRVQEARLINRAGRRQEGR